MSVNEFKPKFPFRCPTIFIAVSCFSLLSIANAQADSLDEIVSKVLGENPRIKSMESATQSAESDLDISSASSLPNVSVQFSSGEELANTPTSRSIIGGDSTENSDQANVTITQNIFSGFKNSNEKRASQSALDASQRNEELVRQDTSLQVVNYYLDVLLWETLLAQTESSRDTHQTLTQLIRDRSVNNVSSNTDLALAESRLLLVESKREEYLGLYQGAKRRFTQYIGVEAVDLEKPTVVLPEGSLDATGIVDKIRENNYQVQADYSRYEQQKYLSEASKSSLYPRIDFEVSGNYRNQTARQSLIQNGGRESDSFIGIRISYDLYTGGANRASRSRGVSSREQARYEWLDSVMQVSAETVSHMENIKGLENSLDRHNQYVQQLEIVADGFQQQFDVNLRGALNLLDQEVELFRAKVDTTIMEYDLLRLKYRLAANNGELLSVIFK